MQALVRRPTLAAAGIYLVLSCIMFAPGAAPGRTLSTSDALWSAAPWEHIRPPDVPVQGSNPERGDATSVFEPFLQHTRAVLPDVPLWNPHIMGGRPFLANPQSAVVSPFSVPAYVLPFWDSLALIAALKLFVAALGAFLLGRTLGMRFGGALLAGIVFGFSMWSVTWVSWTTMSVWAYLPWLCLLSELCVRRPGPLPFAGLAAAVGLQFVAGHPSSSFQVVAVVAAFWAVRAVVMSKPRREAGVRLLTLGSALVAGAALAAIVLIPFVEVLGHSQDLQARTAGGGPGGHVPGRYLLGAFLHDWWGRGSRMALEFAAALEEHAYYVGALTLLLVAAALVLRPRRERLVVAILGAAMLAVSTGAPVLFDLVDSLPGFSASTTGRLAVITVLCAALLAGWGLDDLAAPQGAARRRGAVLGVGLAIVVLPLVVAFAGSNVHAEALPDALRVAWGSTTPGRELAALEAGERPDVIRLASLLEWLGVALAGAGLLVLRGRGRLAATGFTALAIALVALDLLKAGMGFNPAIDKEDAQPPATAAVRFLQARSAVRFAGLSPLAPFSFAPPLPANQAMRYGLYDARGYDIPVEERYSRMWEQTVSLNPQCNYALCPNAAGSTPRALAALGVLGVRYLLQAPRDRPLPKLRTAYAGPDARVYENPRALPPAFLVGRQLVVGGRDAALAAITSPRFPGRTVAITEERLPGLSLWPRGEDRAAGEADVTLREAERTVVRTAARRPALLVVTDRWDTGWEATVDGRDAPLHRVDYLVRGIPVPAGSHRVELRYRPASWRAGWIVSGLALVLLAGAGVIGVRRRRGAASAA